MDKIIDYLEEYSDEPIEEQVRLRNIEFLERLKAGKVNYEWTVHDTTHEKTKVLVEQLTRERSVKRAVERRKHNEKVDSERRSGEDRRG